MYVHLSLREELTTSALQMATMIRMKLEDQKRKEGCRLQQYDSKLIILLRWSVMKVYGRSASVLFISNPEIRTQLCSIYIQP